MATPRSLAASSELSVGALLAKKFAAQALAVSLAAEIDALEGDAEAVRHALFAKFVVATNAIPTAMLPDERVRLSLVLRRRFDEISESVDAALVRKRAALEAEQVAVDSVIEQIAAASSAPHESSAEAADAALSGQEQGRLVRLDAMLASLPSRPLEPRGIRLVDVGDICGEGMALEERLLASLGRLVVVRGARASDVMLAPPPRFARPGRPLRLSLRLGPSWSPPLPSDDVSATLAHLAAHVSSNVAFLDGTPLDAPLAVTPDPPQSSSVTVSFAIPPSVALGARLSLAISVGAVRVPSAVDFILVSCGVTPGLSIHAGPSAHEENDYRVPVPLASGVICAPRNRMFELSATAFDAFDSDGAPLPPHAPCLFGHEEVGFVQAMAAAEVGCWWPQEPRPACGAMIVVCRAKLGRLAVFAASEATACSAETPVVGDDVVATRPFWSINIDDGPCYCRGLAALSRAGVAVVGTWGPDGFLSVHSLATGEPLARSPVVLFAGPIAADDSAVVEDAARAAGQDGRYADVFVSAREAPSRRPSGEAGTFQVYRFRWTGKELVSQVRVARTPSAAPIHSTVTCFARLQGPVEGASATGTHLALAVVPRSHVVPCAHLVVCPRGEDTLCVLALPGLALVHTYALPGGATVTALAADPGGASLIVVDHAGGHAVIRAIAWPLPGMLEGPHARVSID